MYVVVVGYQGSSWKEKSDYPRYIQHLFYLFICFITAAPFVILIYAYTRYASSFTCKTNSLI